MQIDRLVLTLPLRLGTVNCYLLDTGSGYVLVDTGPASQRLALSQWLLDRGVRSLSLIVLTHGDFDHTGNARALRQQLGAPIAMDAGDRGMAERGDMFSGRNKGNRLMGWAARLMFGFGHAERFEPDMLLDDGPVLTEWGLDAQVFSLPGHSSGSLGLFTSDGALFCGDLLENVAEGPSLGSIMDNPNAARASIARLQDLAIHTVYPGHGQPFDGAALLGL